MLALVGVPDFLGCVRGRFVAIELKKDKETKPSKLQRYVLEQIRRAGGYGFVAYPENAKKILSKIERI
jgi:hypothetical protein